MAPSNPGFGRRFTAFCGTRTLKDIGDLLGVTAAAVQRYQNGRTPKPEILDRLATVSKRSAQWWIFGEHKQQERIEEPIAPLGNLAREKLEIIKELEALLEAADDDIKRHLRQQIKLLWRAVKTPPRRSEG